ncbi:hypothetical protein DFH06DRAFT_1022290 [Mycena polygramma]|nr:hypothetical protein DFH06DRAFT_1022290 [Mycena polygramma]
MAPAFTYSTIAIASHQHSRHTQPKPRAPLTTEARKEKKEDRARRQSEQDEAVSNWIADVYQGASDLGERFNKEQRYFLDILMQGGAHMVRHQDEVNPYNAWKAAKAAELREEGTPLNAKEIHKQYGNEYYALTDAEKDALIIAHKKVATRSVKLRRNTPRACIQDVANIVQNIQLLMIGLNARVGIEGFFCIVRNTTQFHMKPQWYFTSEELENYMQIACRKRWNTEEVGSKIEAFSVAGCDVMSASPSPFLFFFAHHTFPRLTTHVEAKIRLPQA